MLPPRFAGPRRALPPWLGDSLRTSLHLFRKVVETSLLLLFFALSIRFALQFDHPAKWETWRLTNVIRAVSDLVVAWTADALGYEWPTPRVSFLPLGIALVVWMARGILAHRLELLRRMVRRPEAEGARIEDAERVWLTRAAGLNMAEHTTIASGTTTPGGSSSKD